MSKNNNRIENPSLPASVKRQLHKAIRVVAEGKQLQQRADEKKEQGKEILLPLMSSYDFSKYHLEGIGRVYRKQSAGSRINDKVLTEKLLVAGVDPKIISRCIKAATKTWSTEYVEFRW